MAWTEIQTIGSEDGEGIVVQRSDEEMVIESSVASVTLADAIPAGSTVRLASARNIEAVTCSEATHLGLGTAADPVAFGTWLLADDTLNDEVPLPEAVNVETDVLLQPVDSNGVVAGTIDSGTVRVSLTVETVIPLGETVPPTPQVSDGDVSTIAISAERCPADDDTTVTVTVTLMETDETPVVGHTVEITATANGTSVTIGDPGVTNAQGVATITAKSSVVHGGENKTELTATDTTNVGSEVELTETVEVEFYGALTPSVPVLNLGYSKGTPKPYRHTSQTLTVTASPAYPGAEITAAKVGSAAWLTVPETFTDGEAETVEVGAAYIPSDVLAQLADKDEVLLFSGEGYDDLEVPVTFKVTA